MGKHRAEVSETFSLLFLFFSSFHLFFPSEILQVVAVMLCGHCGHSSGPFWPWCRDHVSALSLRTGLRLQSASPCSGLLETVSGWCVYRLDQG
ncbi:hypothetical protein J3F83DRAFT_67468 [Trichoderma novae-zelandiae]